MPDFAYNEEEEAVSLMSDITTYCTESILKFIIGEKDLSEFDDYLETLRNMGMETVLDAYSARYAELYNEPYLFGTGHRFSAALYRKLFCAFVSAVLQESILLSHRENDKI